MTARRRWKEDSAKRSAGAVPARRAQACGAGEKQGGAERRLGVRPWRGRKKIWRAKLITNKKKILYTRTRLCYYLW